MRFFSVKLLTVLGAGFLLTACSGGDPKLMNLRSSQAGPDEFAILPTKPLQEPENYAALPPPTPGGTNVSDPTPNADAVAALGGQLRNTGLRGGEGALVTAASRYGVGSGIRNQLAAEDLKWRQENRGKVLERLFGVNVYYSAYEAHELDQHRELERMRRSGVWTPAAPPDPAAAQ
ncbi:DUF3035 domain-containing protein [Aliiroseovarius sp. S1339]|uniref:DUF3035 domain-containing protein n=1 Tax=Aliiroseovarius sp. S1339 TaxID=2936990 RepID=UPI0020C0BE64|nr:DUF3035 domain-containing protein [Aliiroseovarius sp. S1339]MCK8463485.1 DUF3035 domain-containing protein [Aliiroseovarius sp. S1339]